MGSSGESNGSGPELSRDLGFFAVFTTATGTMIGAGIFVLPGVAAESAGPGAALSFLFAGLIAGVSALSVCELATAMPKAGGPYYFVSRAMGPVVGSMVGLGGWLSLIVKGSFALVGLAQYVIYFSPVPILVSALVAGLLLIVVNLVGAKVSGVLQNIVVLALLGILAVFVVKGFFAVDMSTMRPMLPFGWSGVFSTTGIVFISYLGIIKAASVAEEVENPGRNLPLGILSSVVVVTILYVCTMLIVTGVMPIPEIIAATAPLSDAGQIFLGAMGGAIVAVSGLLATLSTGNAAILSSARYPFAMSRDRLMTRWISQIHPKFKTPSRAILVTGGLMLALVVLLDVESLAKLGGVFGILAFAFVNLAVIMLRWTAPDWYEPTFRVPFLPLLPIAGTVAALSLIPQLGLMSHLAAVGFVVVGVGWYIWHARAAAKQDEQVQPEYGLADKILEVRQHWAIAAKRKSRDSDAETARARPAVEIPERGAADEDESVGPPAVVAELERGKPNKHLLALAAALATRHEGPVDAIMVTEVPIQSPLTGPVPPPPKNWFDKLNENIATHPIPFRFHHVVARDRAHAILRFAEPEVRTVLLDWHPEFRRLKLRGSFVDQVLRESPVRVAVLKYRGHKKYERILVATAGSPMATAEIEIADVVAAYTGAELTFLMVLHPEASEHREEQAYEYLERLDELTEQKARLQVVRGDDIVDEILLAGEDHDLIVLGATRRFSFKQLFGRHLVGSIADEITERSTGSVLVTKDPRATARLSRRFVVWLRSLRVRIFGGEAPPASALPEHLADDPEIEVFPRESRRRR